MFSPWRLKLAKDNFWCHWCPSEYSNHQESPLSPSAHPLNVGRIPLGGISLPLTITSIRNLFFLLHGVLNRVTTIFCGTDFFLNFPSPGIISFFYMDNALSSNRQADFFSLTIFYHWFLSWRLIFYPFHWTLDRSLNTFLLCPAGRLSPPSQPSSLGLFHVDYAVNFHQYL